MAKHTKTYCDVCGFPCDTSEARWSSYNTVRCPDCFDGHYDLKNHPQNFPAPPRAEQEPIPKGRVQHPAPDATNVWTARMSIYYDAPVSVSA